MLWPGGDAGVKAINGLHQAMEWGLLVLIGIHVAAALAHIFGYRDRIMQRMLLGRPWGNLRARQHDVPTVR
jgi:cytochrome b561